MYFSLHRCYIFISAWVSTLLVLTVPGNAKASIRGTSDKRSRAFFMSANKRLAKHYPVSVDRNTVKGQIMLPVYDYFINLNINLL